MLSILRSTSSSVGFPLSVIEEDPLVPLRRGALYQAIYKFDWGFEQLDHANAIVADWVANGGVGVRGEFDENGHRFIMYAQRMPWQVPAMIGSGIHGLRSALDAAVSVIIEGAGGKPGARVGFPVHGTERELKAAFEPGKRVCPDCKTERETKAAQWEIVKHAPDLQKLILEVFKPWEDGNYPLWALNKLDNLQKHRMLLLVFASTAATFNYNTVEGVSAMYNEWRIRPGMEMEIARSRYQIMHRDPPRLQTSLVFPDGVPFAGEPVFEILKQFVELVRGIIITLHSHFKGSDPEL